MVDDKTNKIAVTETSVDLKAVTFTASQVSSSNSSLVLTDNEGKTKYYAGANLVTIALPDGQHGSTVIVAKVEVTVATGGDLAQSLASIYADTTNGFTTFTLRARAKAGSQVRVDDATEEASHDYATDVGTSYVDFECALAADGSTSSWTEKTFTASIAGREGQETVTDYTDAQRTIELILGKGTGASFTPFNA